MQKKKLFASLVFATVLTPCVSKYVLATGFPVFDGASLTQALLEIQKLKEQAETLVDTYENQRSQLESLTGNKGFGSILNGDLKSASYKVLSGMEFQSQLDSIDKAGPNGLSQEARTYYKEMNIDKKCSNTHATLEEICKKSGAVDAQNLASYDRISEASMAKAKEIIAKSETIAKTQDLKAIQEYAASAQSDMQLLDLQFKTLDQMQKLKDARKEYYDQQYRAELMRLYGEPEVYFK